MEGPVVTVKQGSLRGRVMRSPKGEKINCFLGIPYGEPPVGNLRFKPPVPAKSWSNIRDATKEGNSCSQIQMLSKTYTGNEDCLFLNVLTPDVNFTSANLKKIPVIVHIHGGGFINGSGNLDMFSPDFLIEQEVIVVTINYRLNIFGFLCLDIPEVTGNMGLRDQNLALKWIKENIQNFGGDPENITLFGISAGAAAVEYHVLSPLSKGLFHKAILESGSTLNPWVRSRNPLDLAKRVVENLNGTYESPKQAFEFLKAQKAEDLAKASFFIKIDKDLVNTEFFLFSPVVEKEFPGVEAFLKEEPIKTMREGKFPMLPTLSGFCDKEGVLFKFFYENRNVDKMKQHRYIDFLPPYFYKDKIATDDKLRDVYKKDFEDKNRDDFVNNFISDLLFIGGIVTSLDYRLKYSQLNNYFYQFTYDGRLNYVKQVFNLKEQGACHGDDFTYLSKSPYIDEGRAQESDIKVRNRMVQMWTDFAKVGNPTPIKSTLIKTIWQPTTKEKTCLLEIGNELVMRTNPIPERINLWREFYNNIV